MSDLFGSSSAVISPCGLYRYQLTRRWSSGPICVFVMLNPSTADATFNDATIRRCMAFAMREGCGGLMVVNLYSLRTKDPAVLARHEHPNGPMAAYYIAEALRAADGPVICGWGADPLALYQSGFMLDLIRAAGKKPMCLGVTNGGHPRHPLYLPSTTRLIPYEVE